jgi:menaquinone-9 beta-reductase
VVVIGAGPAGLAAAISLGERGLSVLVCENAERPSDKPCGEGLLPSALDELALLGVDEGTALGAGHVLRGVRYVSHQGVIAEGSFGHRAGVGLHRRELQRLLRRRAEGTAGVSFRQATARIVPGPRGCAVKLPSGVSSPRLVVAADGLASRARRDAGLSWEHPGPPRYGARQHYALEPWSDQVEVHFHPHGEAYVTPVAPGELNVAVLWQGERGAPAKGGAALMPSLIQRFPELSRRLRGAEPLDRAQSRGPLHVRVPQPTRDGLVLVGDAAGYLDAITGEGVGLALAQARLLARHVAPLLERTRGPVPAAALTPYVREVRQRERTHARLTRALLWLCGSPRLLEQAIQALSRDPALFRHLLSANQGRAEALPLLARSAWQLCRHLLPLGSGAPRTA